MKATKITVPLAMCLAGVMVCYASDQYMGTWKLNEAKSKLAQGTTRNTVVVYEPAGDQVRVTTDGTSGDGSPAHSEWTGKLDGKDYPVTGDPSQDTRAYMTVDEHTLSFTNKKNGKVTTSGRIAISADGKSRTVTVHGTSADGKEVSSTAVYDKQ